MKYKEQKIASFQDKNHRWQLIKMTYDGIIRNDELIKEPRIQFQIRKDRRVITTIKWEDTAKKRFSLYISDELNQLKLF